jgi:nitrogen fixation protein FixH
MTCQTNTSAFTGMPMWAGIVDFFGKVIWILCSHSMCQLSLQASSPSGLNLYRNNPTVDLQGQSGYVHKAVA